MEILQRMSMLACP